MKISLVPVLWFAISSTLVAATRNVPGDYPTIQAAINASNPGDTVLVAPATYLEVIDFKGKAITVRSSGGAAVTTIQAPSGGSVVTFKMGETRSSELEGFTVRSGTGTVLGGGSDTFGGGVLVTSSSPTIRDCVITSNTAQGLFLAPGGSGGGLYMTNTSALLEDVTVLSNTATDDGGGVWASSSGGFEVLGCTIQQNIAAGNCGAGLCLSGTVLIEDSLITNNAFSQFGGGVSFGSGIIRRTQFINNGCTDKGGGLYVGGSPIIEDCEFRGNVAGLIFGDGGGIYCAGGSATISRCVVIDNRASSAVSTGGGIATNNASPIISSCLIVDNTSQAGGSTAYGGGLSLTGGSPVLTGVTIANNWAQDDGGGIWISGSTPIITNCIVWNNTAPVGAQISDPTALATVTFSDVEGSWPGAGNIDSDPLFIDAPSGDYHIHVNSPCFDAGTDVAPNLPAFDFEQDARIHYVHADMGGDEFAGCAVLMNEFGVGLSGSGGFVPRLFGDGRSCEAGGHTIRVREALGAAPCTLWIGVNDSDIPAFGGRLYIDLASPFFLFNLSLAGPAGAPGRGFINIPGGNVSPFPGLVLYLQVTVLDPGAIRNVAMTNALEFLIGE